MGDRFGSCCHSQLMGGSEYWTRRTCGWAVWIRYTSAFWSLPQKCVSFPTRNLKERMAVLR